MTTILTEAGAFESAGARAVGDALWLTGEECERITGWNLKPEGLCQGDVCIPLPQGRENEFSDQDEVNISAFWQHMDRPVLHDKAGDTWMLGVGHADRANALKSLDAPDFSLPDINGDMHALADFRGKRVFLTTWSSW
ncbi:MAG: hypothetical protein AAF387_16950 [Pseudomonadota bacterium]